MDYSKIRQKIYCLDQERRTLLPLVMRPGEMIQGSLYRIWRICGNPRCVCVKGKKHVSWYFSCRWEGHTRLTYIGREVPRHIQERVGRYRRQQCLLMRIRRIDIAIMEALTVLRKSMIQDIEEARKVKRWTCTSMRKTNLMFKAV